MTATEASAFPWPPGADAAGMTFQDVVQLACVSAVLQAAPVILGDSEILIRQSVRKTVRYGLMAADAFFELRQEARA